MFHNRLTWCLERHDLLTVHKCGYRKHHSTTDQLLYLENAVQKSFIDIATVLFALVKAFDKTWETQRPV